jgi:Ca2+-binding RTX toxin-like protein
MNMRLFSKLAVFALVVLVLVSIITAATAANTVALSHLTDQTTAIIANTLKPTECAALTLTTILVCPSTGTCTGTNAAELILGSVNGQTINGRNGNDCILGGAGNDTINGGAGTDVCIGGPGTDTFNKNCETQIQ